jgi:hypothetical protein
MSNPVRFAFPVNAWNAERAATTSTLRNFGRIVKEAKGNLRLRWEFLKAWKTQTDVSRANAFGIDSEAPAVTPLRDLPIVPRMWVSFLLSIVP